MCFFSAWLFSSLLLSFLPSALPHVLFLGHSFHGVFSEPSLLHSSATAPPATATRPPATDQSGVNIPAPAAFVGVVVAVVDAPVLVLVLVVLEVAVLLWVLEEDVMAVCFTSGVSDCSK